MGSTHFFFQAKGPRICLHIFREFFPSTPASRGASVWRHFQPFSGGRLAARDGKCEKHLCLEFPADSQTFVCIGYIIVYSHLHITVVIWIQIRRLSCRYLKFVIWKIFHEQPKVKMLEYFKPLTELQMLLKPT